MRIGNAVNFEQFSLSCLATIGSSFIKLLHDRLDDCQLVPTETITGPIQRNTCVCLQSPTVPLFPSFKKSQQLHSLSYLAVFSWSVLIEAT